MFTSIIANILAGLGFIEQVISPPTSTDTPAVALVRDLGSLALKLFPEKTALVAPIVNSFTASDAAAKNLLTSINAVVASHDPQAFVALALPYVSSIVPGAGASLTPILTAIAADATAAKAFAAIVTSSIAGVIAPVVVAPTVPLVDTANAPEVKVVSLHSSGGDE